MRFADFIDLYFLALFLCLAAVALYYHLARFEIDESDRLRLTRANLNLEVILGLLEAPDTRYLLARSRQGRYVFIEYSRSLREDVLSLIRTQEVGIKSYVLAAVFYAAYFAMYGKSVVSASLNDIRVLSALELRLVRSLMA